MTRRYFFRLGGTRTCVLYIQIYFRIFTPKKHQPSFGSWLSNAKNRSFFLFFFEFSLKSIWNPWNSSIFRRFPSILTSVQGHSARTLVVIYNTCGAACKNPTCSFSYLQGQGFFQQPFLAGSATSQCRPCTHNRICNDSTLFFAVPRNLWTCTSARNFRKFLHLKFIGGESFTI